MNPSEQITQHISELADWRGTTIAHLRSLIHTAVPGIEEAWKWDTPVFTFAGKSIVAVGAFKDHVKLNFFKGASLNDPHKLFNAGLEAKTSRGIDLSEGGSLDETALKELIQAAVALEGTGAKAKPASSASKSKPAPAPKPKSKPTASSSKSKPIKSAKKGK